MALLRFAMRSPKAPRAMKSGAKEAGLRSVSSRLSLLMSPRRRICAVIVVPMLAPMTTGTACPSFMMPALTKPTAMTEVAAELWMTAVTPAPSARPLTGLLVRRSSVFSRWAPAKRSRETPSSFIP